MRRPGVLARFADSCTGQIASLFRRKQWYLRVRAPGETDWRSVLPPYRDVSWADPFPVHHDGRDWLFFEEVPEPRQPGRIVAAPLGSDGLPAGAPIPVLEAAHHLSYPFIFRWEENWYLLPEARASETVTLYRCTEWPGQWVPASVLLPGTEAVDATLLEHAGRWWLFATQPEKPGGPARTALHLYHADSPVSNNWIRHPANPVVQDIRCGRPAGRILRAGKNLYRPAQDASVRYGWGLDFRRIDTLTESTYEESPAGFFRHRASVATHTWNTLGATMYTDAARY